MYRSIKHHKHFFVCKLLISRKSNSNHHFHGKSWKNSCADVKNLFTKQSNMLQKSMNLQVGQSRNKEKYSIYNKCSIKFFASSTRLTLIQDDNSISYLIESIPLLKNPFKR